MKDTRAIGNRTEAIVLAALLELYSNVLVPFGSSHKYDLVFEDKSGKFNRVQCKTGNLKNGVIEFQTHSKGSTYHGEVDFFGVCCSGSNDVYLIPIEIASGKRGCQIRINATKSTHPSIKWARDYIITPQSFNG